jgi:hypothetical protein
MATKRPQIGDKIEHTCSYHGKFEGEVIQLLSAQFIYKTATGSDRFCLFKEDWKLIK